MADEEIKQPEKRQNNRRLPPVETRFKKGQSGNPGGRPKKLPITELYEEMYNDPAFMDLIRAGLRSTAKKGSIPLVMHLKDAGERLEGKVAQKLNVELNVSLSERMRKALERADD